MYLPRYSERPKTADASASATELAAPTSSGVVLLVEDNVDVAAGVTAEVVAGIWTAGSVERPGPEPADNAGRGTGE
ncbi:MAG: hypothetical protein CPDRYMAC_5894 [uncultured Paraburkholderia sp.]|nr:MAG: hypothetical protein CPDRYDRY_5905 [uncultured Paraburkholderia sp.]CAH2942852.1 MAG: hypothetical protein CPDRYMAC_5894 [uncultured Paraburkholderia sp.]